MEKKIIFLGDIVCTEYDLLENNDFTGWFDLVKSSWVGADYVIANLETPIAGEQMQYTYGLYSFNSPQALPKAMSDAGISFVSTANNHCLDRGIQGAFATIEALDELGIQHTGTFINKEDIRYEIITCGDLRIGICAATYGTNAQENKNYLRKKDRFCVNLLQSQEYANVIERKLGLSKNEKLRKWYMNFLENIGSYNAYKAAHERKEKDAYQKCMLKATLEAMKKASDFQIVLLHEGNQFIKQPSKRMLHTIQWLHEQDVDLVVGNHEHIVSGIIKEESFLATLALGDLTGAIGFSQGKMGRRAEFSIVLNMYISEQGQVRYTFSIVKRIRRGTKIYPVYLFDLYEKEADLKKKRQLYWEAIRIYNTVTGSQVTKIEMQQEYLLK